MQNIFFAISTKQEIVALVKNILLSRYRSTEQSANDSVMQLEQYIKEFDDGIQIAVEHPYVDKMFRNTYYHYYASKLKSYHRDSIRLSFFDKAINKEHFKTKEGYGLLQVAYKGFLVLRPTFPQIIGRSVLHPGLFGGLTVATCIVEVKATVNGLKFIAKGFPHSSQDGEMLTCAETTLWSIMEYFGNKYPDYKPLSPHLINNILNSISHERLMPSHGLNQVQLSFAIKELGFGVRMYNREAYEDFEALLKTYVESGIPIIVTLGNENLGHAVNIIGREIGQFTKIDELAPLYVLPNGKVLYDWLSLPVKYVFIDDNLPPYKTAYLDNPVAHYTGNPEWQGCKIDNFVVPLYPKIYMEADQARELSIQILKEKVKFPTTDPLVVKTFLSSSRSFKHYIALNEEINTVLKDLLLTLSMPKFVWITELSTFEEASRGLCSGLLILDATEPKTFSALATIAEQKAIFLTDDVFSQVELSLQPFTCYTSNLIKSV